MDRAVIAADIAEPEKRQRLPVLREDLVLQSAAASSHGPPSWLIYDALRHKYHWLDQSTFAVLSLWRTHATAESLIEAAGAHLGCPVTRQEIDRLCAFLDVNHLTEGGSSSGWRQQSAAAEKQRPRLFQRLVHNYLFFKVPIVSPEPFLRSTLPLAAVFYKRRTQIFIGLLGLLGLYLASREWDKFLFETRDLATLGGAASIAIVLFVVKGLHELGHAYTAVRYGCRVPSIGLAFMMMTPMLYTDVTDAWRLKDRTQRLAIDSAGIAVEIGLACLATVAWVFMADGIARHFAFLIATTSWIMSIGINLNPFMRFDGYYILGDLLRIENLQSRSFALGVWRLREFLFDLKLPSPETMPARLRNILIAYAYGIWIYRLVLFTGIALLVYAYFFKALGVILFLFEIIYFIARPLVGEFLQWWKMRKTILKTQRFVLTSALIFSAALLCVVPWSARVRIPAMHEGNELTRVFPPRAARITSIHAIVGQTVKRGDVLIKLEAPDLAHELEVAHAKLDAIDLRLRRQSADREDRSANQVFEGERAALKMQIEGLGNQAGELVVRAATDGRIAEINSNLRVNQWIAAKEQIALIDGALTSRVTGYVSEDNLWRLQLGSAGQFIPDVPLAASVSVTLHEVAATGAATIELPELASPNGGTIDVHADARQKLIPSTAQYLVTLTTNGASEPASSAMRGTVLVDARAESLAAGAWRRIMKILVRESGV